MTDRIIDFHIHVGDKQHWAPGSLELSQSFENGSGAQWDADGRVDVDSLLAHMDDAGVEHACLIPVDAQRAGTATLEVAARGRGRLHPFVWVDPRNAPDAPAQLEAAIDRGAKGLKVHLVHSAIYANDPGLYPLYEVCRDRGIPVMFHTGSSIFPGARHRFSDPMMIDEAAEDFPDLQLLCAHAGRGFWEAQTFFLARIRTNVHLEMSGVPAARVLQLFPELDRIRDRVVYGSDWPAAPSLDVVAERFRALPLSPASLTAMMRENAVRLLGLPTVA